MMHRLPLPTGKHAHVRRSSLQLVLLAGPIQVAQRCSCPVLDGCDPHAPHDAVICQVQRYRYHCDFPTSHHVLALRPLASCHQRVPRQISVTQHSGTLHHSLPFPVDSRCSLHSALQMAAPTLHPSRAARGASPCENHVEVPCEGGCPSRDRRHHHSRPLSSNRSRPTHWTSVRCWPERRRLRAPALHGHDGGQLQRDPGQVQQQHQLSLQRLQQAVPRHPLPHCHPRPHHTQPR